MPDLENINFLDLSCLFKIAPETTLERFGSVINASIFDAANITGSLKQKGLIDFTAFYPGPNSIIVTEQGKKLKEEAETRSAEPVDNLDDEILRQMSGGKRFPTELQSTINIRSKDLAFRIYKLYKQNYIGYELKNGNVELMLTEQGFLRAKPTQMVQPPKPLVMTPPPQMQPQKAPAMQQQAASAGQPAEPMNADQVEAMVKKKKKGRQRLMLGLTAIIIIILIGVVLYEQGLLPFTV